MFISYFNQKISVLNHILEEQGKEIKDILRTRDGI
jgi:hypothetical protein